MYVIFCQIHTIQKREEKIVKNDKLQMILAMVIFGTIGLVRRYIPYPSEWIAFIRGFVGVSFLLLLQMLYKKTFVWEPVKHNLALLLVSGACLGFNWILLFEAYCYTSVAVATICYYMAPVIVIVLSLVVLKETITLKKGLCAMGAVVGMVLVTNVINSGVSGLQGVFFGLGAAVLYAAVVLLNKKITDIPSRDRTVFQLGISAVTLLPYVMVKGNITSFTPEPLALSMLLMAGIVHTGIAYSLYFGSINRISAQTVALFSYIDPIVAVLLSAFVLHEPMTPVMAAGVVLVIVSAVVSEIDLTALNLFQ